MVAVPAGAEVGQGRPSTIPSSAREVAPGVFDLGKAKDPKTGKMVDGLAIVHYKKNEARGGSAKAPRAGTKCYGFLASGAKWKTNENWVLNASNPDGLDTDNLFSIMNAGVTKWEAAAGADVMGAGSATTDTLFAGEALNNVNEVEFSNLDSVSTIAVTTVWGYFGGPVLTREIIEWDMQFNTGFAWSAAVGGVADKMDFDNIATHELGHAFGMADLYTGSCGNETMFGYADNAETNKRDLNSGDIKGVSSLY